MACLLRIGLTGGMGSGKSEAARRFAELGIPVIDTDVIARELVGPGQPALLELVEAFGSEVLDESGQLNRSRLRQLIFSDAILRRKLESILHPRIRECAVARTDGIDALYCVLVIPLLLETGKKYPIDRILVVDAPPELQYQRIAMRDGLSDREIAAILSAQVNREQRLQSADDIIVNDSGIDALRAQVDELHRFYLDLASEDRNTEESPPG